MSETARYLIAMGITPWVLRDPPLDAKVEPVTLDVAVATVQADEPAGTAEANAPVAPVATVEPDAPRAPLADWLIQASDQPVAAVVVAWPDRSLRLDDGGEAAQMLSKILRAMGPGLDRFQVTGWVLGESPPSVENSTVFCFSDNPESMHPDWVALPSLFRMVAEGAAAKRPAWAILKQWIGRL